MPEGMDRTFEILLSDIAPEALTFTLVGGPSGQYSLSPVPIVISKGEDRVMVTIRALNDAAAEFDEVFTLSLMSDSSLVMIGDRGSITVTIPENDQPIVVVPEVVTATLSLENITVPEGMDRTFEILLSDIAPEALTFTLVGGQSGQYSLSPVPIVISKGEDRVTVTIRALNDAAAEFDEVFTLSLMSDSSLVMIGDRGSITVTIPENDEAPARSVSFVAASSTSEEGTTANVEVKLEGDLHESEVVVSFTVGGTAVAGADFTSPVTSVTIPAGMRSAMITFAITSDSRYEGADETVVLTLTSATGDVTVGTPRVHTVKIMDNETAPTVVFDTGSSTVAEGDSANVVVELEGDLHESEVVVSFTVGGTAVAGADFTSPVTSVTIPAGMRSAMITFAITSDSRYEGADETVVLTLTSATGDVTVGTPSVHTVTINETAPTVVFNTDSSTSDEGTTATVEVKLDGDLHESEVVVDFTVGGTAVAGEDYTSPESSVTIPAGMRSAMITFAITSDSRYEGADETVVLTLTSATGDVTVGTPSVHTVTITDNVEVRNEDLDTSVITDTGTYSETLNVVLRDASPMREMLQELPDEYQHLEVSPLVDISFMDDGGDTVSNLAREVTVTISVPVAEVDSLGGPDRISFAVLHDGASQWELLATTYRVVDSEYVFETASDRFSLFGLVLRAEPPVVVGFDSATYRVNEASGTVELTVSVISGVLTETIRLSYAVSDVSTTVSEDYTVTVDMLELSLMTPSVTISVDIIDDALLENAEMFTVVLSGAPAGVTLNPASAEVTIEDDDMVVIGFDPVMYTVDEGAGTIALTVKVLSGDLGRAVTLSYETMDGSAIAGEDYTRKSGMLTLSAGDTETTIVVNITDDALFENAEMFTVVLSGATAGVTFNPASAEVTITDDDMVEIGFDPVMYTVDEGAGTVRTYGQGTQR